MHNRYIFNTLPKYDSLPENGITMLDLTTRTGAMKETIRSKLRTKGVKPVGILQFGKSRPIVYDISDVSFLFDCDFTKHKRTEPVKEKCFTNINRFGLDLQMARQFIKVGVL
jgi:hypothetical protein